MLRTVVAIERDGLDVRVLSLQFDVPNAEFDLKDAVCKASTDYCKTPDGKRTYKYNCSYVSDIEVDWDEQLVDDSQIEDDDEEGFDEEED